MKNVQLKLKNVQWKPIPQTHYSADNWGRIRNDTTGELLLRKPNMHGYLEVNVPESELPTKLVHRLVALAFHDNPWKLPMVDHINRIRYDARAENLQWASYKINNMNRPKNPNCSSQYYGVTAKGKKWRAYVSEDGEIVSLGTYDTELQAGQAYNFYVTTKHLKNQLNVL